MVAYALRITDLDPLQHGLIFERFLNPDRVSMPDFDIDFDERRRGEVIRYVTEKYGEDRVSHDRHLRHHQGQAGRQGRRANPRLPVRHGRPDHQGDAAAVMGKDVPLKQIFDPTHKRFGEGGEFRTLYDTDRTSSRSSRRPWASKASSASGACTRPGVIMSTEPLLDVIPMMKRPQDGAIITQFDYPTCEKLGLIKMDFLGLRNLTVLDDALINIKRNGGETVVLEDLTLDDPKTYALMQRGDTLGVFQLDGGPMRALLRSMRPDSFEDISAVGALYRPGPMGANSHNEYARPQERPRSRSNRFILSWPRRWQTSWARPTV